MSARGKAPGRSRGRAGPVVCERIEDFDRLKEAWNALALPARSPFLTHEWLRSWWTAYPERSPIVLTMVAEDGSLIAGAMVIRPAAGQLEAAVNEYAEHWDVVAVDDRARAALCEGIAELGWRRITLPGIPADSPSIGIASQVLRSRGLRLGIGPHQRSPYLELPAAWDALLSQLSRNRRSQVRRYRKRLEREGILTFRTTRTEPIDADLARFLALEASGWKGRAGTAIASEPRAVSLFTDFAHACAGRGWLRLHMLELDGILVAADYACALADRQFLIKTAFDEDHARLSPGSVLRADVLRAAIEEGARAYDFLGGPDAYKLQWTPQLREHVVLRAYGGVGGLGEYVYRHKARPTAKAVVSLGRGLRARGRRDRPSPGDANRVSEVALAG